MVQHLVTVALGGGFTPDALYEEVRTCHSFQGLSREDFQWALDFVVRGGDSLGTYPEYRRVVEREGIYRVEDRGIALRHRLRVGTIVADAAMLVKSVASGRRAEHGGGSALSPPATNCCTTCWPA